MSSSAQSRLGALLSHFLPSSASPTAADDTNTSVFEHRHNYHTLSPTIFLPRAAEIEPEAPAIYHETADGVILRRTYREFAERARGCAYYVRKQGYKRVGILCTNTPAFLEAIYGIAAAGSVQIGINYRLKSSDISYIFTHAEVDAILVDAEFVPLLADYRVANPTVPILVDTDTASNNGPYDQAVLEGLQIDADSGAHGWEGHAVQAQDEEATFALAYTSGTTARPKGVEYTYRGVYLAALANIIESGLNMPDDRARYLWTLPMFHALGWTFPYAVTAARGTHYCLRRISYPSIWRLLTFESITHFNAAPTVCTLLCADPDATRLPRPVRVTVAASPPTATLFEAMERLNLRPVHVYGLTESYGPITRGYILDAWQALPAREKYAKMAQQGFGFVTSQGVRVVRPDYLDPSGAVVDVTRDGKEVGEIVFSGNICAKGYYRDAAATQKLWAGGVSHSGDLAVWHRSGSIQIIDRGKDIIISGGENISSLAVESLLVTHPAVLEVAIVAVSDEKFGERPKAFLTLKEADRGRVSGEDILKWAKQHPEVSGFMQPREVEILEELPKTSTGKVRKNVLREWAKGGDREGDGSG